MYQETSLIVTKLNIPSISLKLIKRPRLFKKLDAYLYYKLILITAPAGYGKTALITSWLSQKQKRKSITAWLSLDEEDNNPELFWSYFLLSFYKKISLEKDIGKNCVSSYESSAKFNRLHIINLINNVASLDMDLLMVIEDFNVITDGEIIKNIKFLIKNMPLNMHILISSRSFLDLGLASLRVADSILEINQEDLSFTLEETSQFFNKAMDIPLSEDKCTLINNEAEGWIAAMQMTALRMKNLKESSYDKYVYGNHNTVFDYIAEEVFFNLNENIKKFLVFTSIFEQFTSKICDYVLDINNSQEIIEELIDLNLFIIRLDGENKWFRYQNLFRSFLKKHLDNLEMIKIYELFNKIGQWYELNNQINMAIENYIKGNNFEKAVELIQQINQEILYMGEAKLLYKWNERLPDNIVNTNPRLILNSAWGASSDGKPEKVAEYIKKIRKLKKLDPKMKAEIIALRSTNIIGTNNVDEIIEDCKNALESLEPKVFLAQLINLNMAIAYLIKGKIKVAIFYFEKCFSIGIDTNQLYIAIVANTALISSMKLCGQYREIEQKNMKLIVNINLDKNVLFPTVGLLYAQLAEVYYEWNELEKSLEYANKGLKLGLDGEDIWTAAENYLVLAKIYNALGLDNECIASIEKAEESLKDNQLFDIRLRLECYKAHVKLQKDIENPISKWLKDIMLPMEENLVVVYPEIYIIEIRFYICENQLDKAKNVLNRLQKIADENELFGLLVEVKILSSIIYTRLRNPDKALSELENAISLSLKEKPIRIYLNEGNFMKELLRKLKKKLKADDLKEKIEYIDNIINNFKLNLKSNVIETRISLKAREIQILKLIQQGATNSEISEELFISINTVKTHISNIYTKLDVHSRTRAVVRAKELNLIE